MNLKEYLKRINCENFKNTSVSLETLRHLHSNHLLAIPWENFSLAQNDRVIMNLERIYDKVIRRGRGGFCFELNQLFAWLLTQLGFELKLISCRNFLMLQQEYHPWSGHMAMLVCLNNGSQTYLCDVGHSSSPRYPLEFTANKIQQDAIGHYRIIVDPSQENVFTLNRNLNSDLNDSNWLKIYQLNTTPKKIEDFQELLDWSQTPQCARVYNRSFCIKHDVENVHKMLFAYNFTKIYFKDGIEVKREEKNLDETNLIECIQKEMNVNIENDFKPRNIPL